MKKEIIKIPDIGADSVEVIEICVAPGDEVAAEDSLVVLESDKASMEVPSPMAGKVLAIKLSEGDSVAEGDVILELEVAGEAAAAEPEPESAPEAEAPAAAEVAAAAEPAAAAAGAPSVELIAVPDIGGGDGVEVIEVCVAEGDDIDEGDSLVVLESDKASMEVPAPKAGKVLSLKIAVGDKAGEGTPILELEVAGAPAAAAPAPAAPAAEKPAPAAPAPKQPAAAPSTSTAPAARANGSAAAVYAGPAVRKLAREFSIELVEVSGSGPKGRIVKEDLQRYVKQLVENRGAAPVGGGAIPAVPEVDFAKFGEVDVQPLSKLHKLTAANMHRSWLNVPHVTQFDDADITELEDFRGGLKAEAERRGVKITPLPFLLKACAAALRSNPKFNASLSADGEHIVYKDYVHIGMAVDTPAGLVVPVIRDVDKKSIWELCAETAEMAKKAKDRKLSPADMQGGCFTISSLGNIGGTGFTPIVNTPEVAILGVSKLAVKPVWNGSEFVPRKMLPLSLSYDHRAINGGDAGRFFTELGELLGDIRRLVL